MVAYTVTKRAADVETTVRVEIDESMTRHDRAEEIAMALDEAGIGEARPPTPSADIPMSDAIDLAVCRVIGVEWCYVDDDVFEGDPIVVWVRTDPGLAVAVSDIGAAIRSVGAGRDWVVRRVVDTIERDVANSLAERVDTKPLRDRIRADREVFAEIEKLLGNATGGDNVIAACALAKRAAAAPVPK